MLEHIHDEVVTKGGLTLRDLIAVATWVTEREIGASAKFIAFVAITGRVRDHQGHCPAPNDASDFGRCVQLVNVFPSIRSCFPILRTASAEWASCVDNWDAMVRVGFFNYPTRPKVRSMKNGRDAPLVAAVQKAVLDAKSQSILEDLVARRRAWRCQCGFYNSSAKSVCENCQTTRPNAVSSSD